MYQCLVHMLKHKTDIQVDREGTPLTQTTGNHVEGKLAMTKNEAIVIVT